MPFFDRLLAETAQARGEFISIPIIRRAVTSGVDRETYLAFLGQAYHHVRHTCPLLRHAAARCGPEAGDYKDALAGYIAEEDGHERWILDDIRALGGDPLAVRDSLPDLPCRLLVAYAYYAIEQISPYALLGMVHVLEGMSVALAQLGAGAVRQALGVEGNAGFTYLTSHGALDQDHVGFFETLVNGIDDEAAQAAIIDTAKIVYRLYGDVFRALDRQAEARPHAA